MNRSRLINVLIPSLLLGGFCLGVNITLFGVGLGISLTLPIGLCTVAAYLLLNRYRSRQTPHSTFTRLSPGEIQALLARARDLQLHVTAIRAAPVANAEMVWTGWSRHYNRPTWTILFNEAHYAALSQEEVTAVLYHEMGHGLNHDAFYGLPWIAMVGTWFFALILFTADLISHGPSQAWLFVGRFLLHVLMLGVTAALIARLAMVKREYAADEWAVRLSGTLQPMLGFLQDVATREVTPGYGESMRDFLWPTHPPAQQRIAHLKRLTPLSPPNLLAPHPRHDDGKGTD